MVWNSSTSDDAVVISPCFGLFWTSCLRTRHSCHMKVKFAVRDRGCEIHILSTVLIWLVMSSYWINGMENWGERVSQQPYVLVTRPVLAHSQAMWRQTGGHEVTIVWFMFHIFISASFNNNDAFTTRDVFIIRGKAWRENFEKRFIAGKSWKWIYINIIWYRAWVYLLDKKTSDTALYSWIPEFQLKWTTAVMSPTNNVSNIVRQWLNLLKSNGHYMHHPL
jgi:hypothetical protein